MAAAQFGQLVDSCGQCSSMLIIDNPIVGCCLRRQVGGIIGHQGRLVLVRFVVGRRAATSAADHPLVGLEQIVGVLAYVIVFVQKARVLVRVDALVQLGNPLVDRLEFVVEEPSAGRVWQSKIK